MRRPLAAVEQSEVDQRESNGARERNIGIRLTLRSAMYRLEGCGVYWRLMQVRQVEDVEPPSGSLDTHRDDSG